jgi:FixJ family two-component response regulator
MHDLLNPIAPPSAQAPWHPDTALRSAVQGHGLNQRVQALMLLQQRLRETVAGDEPHQLLARLEQTLLTVSGLLGALMEASRIDPDCLDTTIAIFGITDAPGPARAATAPGPDRPTSPGSVAYIVDDNPHVRSTLRDLLESHALIAEDFASAEAFLAAYRPGSGGCLLLDAQLPGMSALALLAALRGRGDHLPTILISDSHDVGLAVDAMRGGACDVLEKPMGRRDLLASITRAIEGSHEIRLVDAAQEDAAARVAGLTMRQHEIFGLVLAGHPSKNIAADLGISQRTVENHRAAIMHKMCAKSLPELARKAQAAEAHPVRGLARKRAPARAEEARLRA